MNKVILSGGPSTGKSTTFEQLHQVYSDAYFVPEAAELVIAEELQKQKDDPIYQPILPVECYEDFAPLVIAKQIELEAQIPEDAGLVIFDRSMVDNIGYLAHNGIEEHVAQVQEHITKAEYGLVFFCDWLGKFEQTAIRHETEAEGYDIHKKLETAYNESGLDIVHLPAVSVESRLAIVHSELGKRALI